MLYVWDEFGLAAAQVGYIQRQLAKMEASKDESSGERPFQKGIPPFEEVLRGKINFLRMVRGKDDAIYRKYLSWYRKLSSRHSALLTGTSDVEPK